MFDAYEVAIKLRLVDHFSSVMGMVTNRLIAANIHAEKLQRSLDGVGRLLKAGAITTGAGFGIAMALKASTNEAVRYEQQLNRLKALNLDNRFGAATTKGLEQKASEIANTTKGITYTDALRIVTETQSITGNVQHTMEMAPVLAQIKYGMETYMSANGKGEGHGESSEKQFQDIVKVMEMRGLMRNFTGEKLEKMADLFAKNYVASGGMVKPSDFLAMMKTGGVAAKSVGDDFMNAMGHIMQEKGGSRSGTALMSGYQNLVAGRMPQQIAETLKSLGLLDAKAIHYGKTGHITKVDAGGLKDSNLYQERPDLYMQKDILPALAKKYNIDINDQNAVLMKLNGLAGQRTAADLLAQLYLERDQIANYVEQSKNAMGVSQLYKQSTTSTTGQLEDLRAQVTNLEKDFGDAALPLLKNALLQVIPLVKEFGKWLEAHPEGLSKLVKGIAGLSVAMMVSGPLMMAGGGLKVLSLGAKLLSSPLGNLSVALAMRGAGGASGIAALANNLGSVGGQLAMLTRAASVFMAAYAGWKLGEVIGNKIDNKVQESSGYGLSSMRDWLAHTWFGKKTGMFNFGQNEALHFVQAPSPSPAHKDKNDVSMFQAPNDDWGTENKKDKYRSPDNFQNAGKKSSHDDQEKKEGSNGISGKFDQSGENYSHEGLAHIIASAVKGSLNGTKVVMEGHTVGNIITDMMGRAASAPSTGTSGFDSRLSAYRSDMAG